MNLVALPPLMMMAIAGYVGLHYLVRYIRNREENFSLSFALLCLSLAGYDFFTAGLYNSQAVADSVVYQKGQFFSICFISVSMLAFYHHLVEKPLNSLFFWLLSAPMPIIAILTVTTDLAVNAEHSAVRTSLFDIIYYEAEPLWWMDVMYCVLLASMTYAFFMLINYYRKSNNKEYLFIVISSVIFFLTALNDILAGAGLINTIYMVEYGFTFLLIAMSYSLVNRSISIQKHVQLLSKQLKALTSDLEDKIKRRTESLENKNRELEEQIQMAKRIQDSLLPHDLPQIPRYDLAFEYRPMMEIGGDLIDVYHFPRNNELALFVGDVSGHGVAAAFLASMVKMSMQPLLRDMKKPAYVLEKLQESLKGKIGDNFLTATFVFINTESGELTLANAGHSPTLIFNGDNSVKTLKPEGRIIFDYTPPQVSEEKYQLQKGDKLVLYTDGITEARDASNEILDDTRLYSFIQNKKDMRPAELCKTVVDYASNYASASHRSDDDLSIMILEYQG